MDLERTMQFIVEQQAAFAAAIGKLEERQDRFQKDLDALASAMSRLIGVVESIADRQQEMSERIAESKLETDRRFRETDEKFRQLAESQQHTDERLNALISFVDRQHRPPG